MSSAAPVWDPSLVAYVEKVWTVNAKNPIQSSHDVYNLYGDSAAQKTDVTWDIASDFADTLLELKRKGGSGCTLVWQTERTPKNPDGFVRDHGEIMVAVTTMKAESVTQATTVSSPTWALLNDDFMHFLNNNSAREATAERIYVHLCAPIAENGKKVMEAVLRRFPSTPQLKSAKLCGACATDRVDSIVVYMSDSNAADRVADALSKDTVLNGCFERGVPLLVNEVRRGIGRVQEPPVTSPLYDADGVTKHALRKSPKPIANNAGLVDRFETANTSFGALHAELIFKGLTKWRTANCHAPQSGPVPQDLLEKIAAAYKKEGIDPSNPSQFPNHADIEKDFHKRALLKYSKQNP